MKVNGASVSALGIGVGLSWAVEPGDAAVARSVVAFLEDRRLLFGDRHVEDERHCIRSALECRAFLTRQIGASRRGGELEQQLKAIRSAFRRFVEQGGPQGVNFVQHFGSSVDPFSAALGELRSRVGVSLAAIAWRYDLNVEEDLARILPPPTDVEDDELSWVPGFGDG